MNWSRCYLYTRKRVKKVVPDNTPGMYRLLSSGRVFPITFYVGHAKNLRKRLLEHLSHRERNRCIKRHLQHRCFFQFAELESVSDRLTIERQQIQKYNPECNIDIRTVLDNLAIPKQPSFI